MIIPAYHIKLKILTSIIAPHGITDLIHATQNNNTQHLVSMNTVCVATSFGLSQNEATSLGLNAIFVISSVIHFRHDFPIIFKNNHQELQRGVFSFVTILSFIVNYDLFFFYMFFLHVPNHYYFNRHIIKKRCIINLSFILSFTLCLSLIGDTQLAFHPFLYPLYKGVVISHVIYQELYVHKYYLTD